MAKGLHYISTLDDTDFKKKLANQRQAILDSGKTAQAQGQMVENSFKKIAQNMAMIGGGISVGYLVNELHAFAGAFDKSMKEVSTISQTVSADMDGFKSSILEMTTEIPVGADAAAKALYQIVSAGHDGANGMQVLEVAAKAAIGGVTETVTAADAITTVLNAYKKDAGEAESISDQLFTTVRLGKTTFGELGQSISQAVPIAASFGIETEQVLAAVATLTKSGTPTAQAMTQIRASIVAASKVLGDGYFATHTFQEGLAEIANRAGGSESELRKLVPEIEAMNGVLGLTGINAKMAAADLAELNRSTGATEQAYQKMVAEAGAQMTILKNTILKKFHDIGKGSVDMVGSFAKLLNSDGLFNDKVIDDVIASLVVLITTVGAYKASLIATNAIQRVSTSVQYAAEMAELTKLLPMKQADANADIMSAVAKGRLSQATAERLIALRGEVAAELEVLRIRAQKLASEAAEAARLDGLALKEALRAERAERFAMQELSNAQLSGNAERIKRAEITLTYETESLNIALKEREKTANDLVTASTSAKSAQTAVDTMQTKLNTAATNGGTTAKRLFTAATLRLRSAFNSLKVAFLSNPIGMILTGVTMAISLFSMFGKKTKEATEELENMKQAVDKIVSQFKEFDDKADGVKRLTDEYVKLSGKVSNTKDESERLKTIIDLLARAYPDAVTKVNKYGDALEINIGKVNRAIEAERKLLLIKNKDAINKVAKEAGGTFNDYVDYSKDEKQSRNSEESIQKSIVSTTLLPSRQKDLKKFLAETKENTLEFKANADQNFDIFYAYIKEMERLSMTSAEIAARINEESGTNLSEGNINWVKQTIEGAKKVNEEIVKQGNKGGNVISLTDEQKKKAETRNKLLLDIEKDYQDSKLSVMKEGQAKELVQIEIETKEKVYAVEKQYQELAKAQGGKLTASQSDQKTATIANVNTLGEDQQAEVRKKYLDQFAQFQLEMTLLNASEEDVRLNNIAQSYEKQKDMLDAMLAGKTITEAQHKSAADTLKANQRIEETRSTNQQLNALMREVETFEQARKRIEVEFAEKRRQMYEEDGETLKQGFTQGNVEEIDRQINKALADIDTSISSSTGLWSSLFENFAYKSKSDLTEIADNARNVLEYVNNTPVDKIEGKFGMSAEQLKTLKNDVSGFADAYEKLNEIESAANSKSPFSALIKGVENYKKSLERADAAKKALESVKANPDSTVSDVKDAEQAVEDAEQASEKIKRNLKESVAEVGQKMSQIGSAFEQAGESLGNDILADVGQAVSLIGETASKLASGDYLGAVLGLFTAWAEAEGRHRKAIKEVQQSTIEYQKEYNALLHDAAMESSDSIFGDKKLLDAKKYYAEAQKQQDILNLKMNDLASGKVVTGHKKTGLFGWGKGKYLYSDILSVYPELIDGNGKFNAGVAETILSTQKLDDTTTQTLNSLVQYSNQAEAAMSALNDISNEIVGGMASTMTDAIFNAIEEGASGWDAFHDSGADAIKALGKMMVEELIITNYLDKYSDDIAEMLGKGDKEGVMDIFKQIATEMPSIYELAADATQQIYDAAGAAGYDMTGKANSAAGAAGAISAQLTEQTGSEMLGMIRLQTDCSIQIRDINYNQFEFMKNGWADIRNLTVAALRIEANTYRTANNTDYLNDGLKEIGSKLEKIERNTAKTYSK